MGGQVARAIEAHNRGPAVGQLTLEESTAAVLSAAVYKGKDMDHQIATPVGAVRLAEQYGSPLRGTCAALFKGDDYDFLAFSGTNFAESPVGDLMADVGVLFGGSLAHMPWKTTILQALREAEERGHTLVITGHSLGGVQAAANYVQLHKHHGGRFLKLHTFNAGTGLVDVAIQTVIPLDAIAQGFFNEGGVSSTHRSINHRIVKDVVSSGVSLGSITKS